MTGQAAPAAQSLLARLRRLLRDPLVLFLVVGAAFFGLTQLYAGVRSHWDRTIVVDDAVQSRLVELFRVEKGRPPRADELQAIAHQYVRDEVLYREGKRLGLDQDDEIIRRRLIQKMDYLADDPASAHQPIAAELETFYKANASRFATPARRSFHHLFFSSDSGDAKARAEAALEAIDAGQPPDHFGDRFPLQAAYTGLGAEDALRIFGAPDFAKALLAAPVGKWAGPVQSGYGWHLIHIDQAQPEVLPPFNPDDPDLKSAFLESRSETAKQRSIDELVKRYRVVVRTGGK